MGRRERQVVKGGKKYSRKAIPKTPKAVICYCPQVCPDVMRVQLKYNGRKTSNGGGTVNIEDYIFRGNSCFDPDFAVGGDQPLGFDEWSALYRRYRVIACKADVDFINDAGVSAFGYVTAENTSSAYTDRSNAMEPFFKKSYCGKGCWQ